MMVNSAVGDRSGGRGELFPARIGMQGRLHALHCDGLDRHFRPLLPADIRVTVGRQVHAVIGQRRQQIVDADAGRCDR